MISSLINTEILSEIFYVFIGNLVCISHCQHSVCTAHISRALQPHRAWATTPENTEDFSSLFQFALPTQKVRVVMAWLSSGENVLRSVSTSWTSSRSVSSPWHIHTPAICSSGTVPTQEQWPASRSRPATTARRFSSISSSTFSTPGLRFPRCCIWTVSRD